MGDLEAVMWRLERQDPLLRASITVIAYLDRSPGYARFCHRVDRLTRVVPRFRDRVAQWPGHAPQWRPDPDFALHYHVRLARAPGADGAARVDGADGAARVDGADGTGPDRDTVVRMAEPLASEGFDEARPLWQMTLVEGLAGGEAAVIIKLHHTFTDGVGAARLALVLFDLERDGPDPEDLPPLPEHTDPGGIGQLRDDIGYEVARSLALARDALPMLTGLLRAALQAPEAQAAATARVVRSVAHLAVPAVTPLSPIMTARSLGAALAVLHVPLEDAKRAARAAGGTVNDVFVAAVLEGLRRYHDRHASAPAALRMGLPISVRSAETADQLANQFVPARLVAPLQVRDVAARVATVHQLVAAARAEPALAVTGGMAVVANRLPMAGTAIRTVMRSIDVMASNVPGSPAPLYLGPARLLALVPFGPRGGAALNVTLMSYDGSMDIGINADPAAVPDADVLVACLRRAFAEVGELAEVGEA